MLVEVPTAAAQSVPWWGSAVLGGAFVLAGALAAGAATYLNAWMSQTRMNRRDDRLRWLQNMKEIGADLVAACHDIDEAALLLHKAHVPGAGPIDSFRRSELWDQMVAAQSVLVRASSQLSLIAPEDIAGTAHDVLSGANELGRHCEGPAFDFEAAQTEFSEASADFIMLVREHLGVEPLSRA
ncbi:hypothetical protein [Leifsonia sp. SIMBA_070]|uniref:hypothetical protein n=1 Tax=Leifsonia sp. SIMBA_070 TaxID=3085810 RepID=UPI00397CE285